MPVVHFDPLGKSANVGADETILDAARRANVPVGNSCGAVGVCLRCSVRVVEGSENLSQPSSMEVRATDRGKLGEGERLACQAVVTGDCTVTADYW